MNVLLAAEGLSNRLQLVAILVTAGLVVLVFELIRRRRLMERYSLLWLFAAIVLLILAIFDGLLASFASGVGIATPSNALFAAAIGFLVLLVLHFSTSISRLTDESKVLAQRVALAEERLHRLDGSPDEGEIEAERRELAAEPPVSEHSTS
ncbi:MAG: DUF2304 domain-containing protein [Thermoleophilaceae bacterium]|nr:DUF2304 domain-containing protein [Thermoleophilaceae bacterium]